MTIIGKRIAEIRKLQKLTQQELSIKSDVDYNTLRKVETGKTKNPSTDFVEKIVQGLGIDISDILIEDRPNIQGGDLLPLIQLSSDQFEDMILMILQNKPIEFSDAESYGGRGDKQRDVLAKKIIGTEKSLKYSLFQAKRHKKSTTTTLKSELDGIKAHFFDSLNPVTPVHEIYFCLADTPSADFKDKVKLYAQSLGLPDPTFWDARAISGYCKSIPAVINRYFNGDITSIKEDTQHIPEMLEMLKGVNSFVLSSSYGTVGVKEDEKMSKARRLISGGEFSEAKELLLTISDSVSGSVDKEKRKKLFNNLGVCYINSNIQSDIDKGIEYLLKAIDIDNNFAIAKQNLVASYINSGKDELLGEALKYAKQNYMSDETNIEYIGIYLQVLSLIKDYKEADSVISKHGITLEKAVGNEALISVMVSIFIGKKDFDSGVEFSSKGVEAYPTSGALNNMYGTLLLMQAEKHGVSSRPFDTIPFYSRIDLVEEALIFFRKAITVIKGNAVMLNRALFSEFVCISLINRAKLQSYEIPTNKVDESLLSPFEVKQKEVLEFGVFLDSNRDYDGAYKHFKCINDKHHISYADTVDFSERFFHHGSPEVAIKILTTIHDEAKENMDLRYWLLLSMSYALVNDKNMAITVANEAKSLFHDKKDDYSKLLAHFSAISLRYQDENERIVENTFELDALNPERKIITPILAVESDGSLSKEIKDFFGAVKEQYDKKKAVFLENPLPFCSLQKMFQKSYPESASLPSDNLDFEFGLPYNALDESFIKRQEDIYSKSESFVIDYSTLLNLSRCGQLGLLQGLKKKVIASEYLLFQVQEDLLHTEDIALRGAWNFLRNGQVEIFPYQEFTKGRVEEWTHELFGIEQIQGMEYAIQHSITYLSDDLRLCNFINSEQVGGKAINSFILFQKGALLKVVDKKQYSLIIGSYADHFYQFLPFNGEDLLTIVLDDENRLRTRSGVLFKPKLNPDMEISRRVFFLLYQMKLPGSDIGSFITVCQDFIIELFRLSSLEETKLNWVIFLTNFFSELIDEDEFPANAKKIEPIINFIVNIWMYPTKVYQSETMKALILKKLDIIQLEAIKGIIRENTANGDKD